MKKKIYEQPEMKVVVLNQADIIATSGYNDGNVRIGGGDGIEMGEEEF